MVLSEPEHSQEIIQTVNPAPSSSHSFIEDLDGNLLEPLHTSPSRRPNTHHYVNPAFLNANYVQNYIETPQKKEVLQTQMRMIRTARLAGVTQEQLDQLDPIENEFHQNQQQ